MTPASTSAQVPFVALDRQHAEVADELREVFDRLLTTCGFILGEEVEAFESEFAEYCGAGHAVGVASGTAALQLALAAAGVGPGDEVIVPAHTFIASALGVIHAGATPVFCDVERDTGLLDPEAAAAAVTDRTAAIVAVHLYGQVCDMGRLRELADRHQLFLLEDAAQAHGAIWQGKRAGSLGDAAAFSFYPSKNLGAMGDGGAVTTPNPAFAEQLVRLRNLGQRRKGEHVVLGYNERLDGLQAGILRVKLGRLDGWNERRRHNAARLLELLGDDVRTLVEREGSQSALHLFPVRVAGRDSVAEHLGRAGVASGVHYSPSVPRHEAILALGLTPDSLEIPESDAWAAEELSLPFFAEAREDELARSASVLHDALRSRVHS